MSEATTERADSVGSEAFVSQYIPLQQSGKTREEIAEALGMKLASFNTKLSTLSTDIFAGTSVIIVGEGDDEQEMTGDEYVAGNDALTLRKLRQAIDKGSVRVAKRGVELPMPKNSRSRRDIGALGALAAQLIGAVDSPEVDSDDDDDES